MAAVRAGDSIGGLVGINNPNATILSSYATAAANGDGCRRFGCRWLGGWLNSGGSIMACYATGAASGGAGSDNLGGLIGTDLQNSSAIVASYATGAVDGNAGTDRVGKLIGRGYSSTITASYGFGSTSMGTASGLGTTVPSSLRLQCRPMLAPLTT